MRPGNTLVIIRGLPGSGKSTMARGLKDEAGFPYYHVEADMYFIKDGVYHFNGINIADAHTWCHKQVAKALENGLNVVVSNTFTQMWEIMPYIDMCAKLKIPYKIVEAKGNYGSIHNIPEAAMNHMRNRWEEIQ
jgi:predicted kinase